MRSLTLLTWLALAVVFTAVSTTSAGDAGGASEAGSASHETPALRERARRWVVFRPMFATKGRQRALNRRQFMAQQLRRQSRHRGQRHKRALHFPQSGGVGGAGSGEESGLALRVSVNDLLFQSAPANDLPEPAARGAVSAGGVRSPSGTSTSGGVGLRPILLARLRAASREREPAAEEEAFLLMSAAGGRPAIVPAPTSRPQQAPTPKKQAHSAHGAHGPRGKHHKRRKGDKGRRRVTRDTLGQRLDARLDAMEGAVQRGGTDMAERVKKYDAQGMYPAYSYTHGRYTRAASPSHDKVQVMKVKVQGVTDDDDDEEEEMDVAENVVFRPLFVHRDMHAAKVDTKRRRLGYAKKPTKPAVKPLRRRQPQPPAPVVPVRRIPAATAWFHRRTYLKAPAQAHYRYSPYRRVVYYH